MENIANTESAKRAYTVKTPKFADFEAVAAESFSPEALPDILAFLRNLESRNMINVRKETREGAGRKSEFESDKFGFLMKIKTGEVIPPHSVSLAQAIESGYVKIEAKLNEKGKAYKALTLTIKAHGFIAKHEKTV
jgi:hypothetical protein